MAIAKNRCGGKGIMSSVQQRGKKELGLNPTWPRPLTTSPADMVTGRRVKTPASGVLT